jgi:hypothetical protein
MPDAEAERLMNVRRQEAAWLVRWVRSQERDEGKRGGPKEGWRVEALTRALQMIADHYGLER